MKDRIVKYLNSVPRYVWILMLIVAVGIFLRAYHFQDWLVFNPDQARDATLIDKALENSKNIPLLGPEAGNTSFQLGPIFYWFEYASAKIFGNTPWAMAYPDLIFSILTIILLYFFSRKYFSVNISLALAAILSISYFAVRYSRFAMNTNSIPFWTLLFLLGILNLLDEKNKKSFFWPMITGIAMGVGIQLHALLIISMPILAVVVLILLIKRRLFTWKNLAIIIFFFLIVNVGQIIYDIDNNGSNSSLFFSSVTQKSNGGIFLRNLGMDCSYQIQANMHMISSLGNQDQPDFIKIADKIIKDKNPYATFLNKSKAVLGLIASLFFSVGGYFLLFYFFKKEKNQRKKDFLLITSLYSVILFLIMIPIINEASLRYFIVILFLPFIFLGLWIKFIVSKSRRFGIGLSVAAIIFLMLSNGYTIKNASAAFFSKSVDDVSNAIMGEIEPMADYILNYSQPSSKAYLIGKNFYLIRFYKPLSYLTEKKGFNLMHVESEKQIESGVPLFYVKDGEEKNRKPGEIYKGHVIKNVQKFNNIMIFNFEN